MKGQIDNATPSLWPGDLQWTAIDLGHWLERLPLPAFSPTEILLLASSVVLLFAVLTLFRKRRQLASSQRARNNAEALAGCLFDALPDPAAIIDPEGRFVSVNPAFAELLGRSEREIARLGLSDLFTPSVAERFEYRPVECDDEDFEEPFALHPGERQRFRPVKTPLFDTSGMLIGVLTQLRPEEPVPTTTAAEEAVRIPPLKEALSHRRSDVSPVNTDTSSDRPSQSPNWPKPAPETGTPMASGPATPDPNIVEALQIAVRVAQGPTKKSDGRRPSHNESATPPGDPDRGREPVGQSTGFRPFEVIDGTDGPEIPTAYSESAFRGRGKP